MSAMEQNDDKDLLLPVHFRTMCNLFFSTIMAIGVVGNVMVIIVIIKTKEMRNSANIFLANLAIADLMTLFVWGTVILFDVNSELNILDRSKAICYAVPCLEDAVTYVSVLTILAISYERYYAICQPMKVGYKCTKRRAYTICLLVWTHAVLYSSLQLFFKVYEPEQHFFGLYFKPECIEQKDSRLKNAYYITRESAFFFLPLSVLIVIFLVIVRNLRGALPSNTNTAAIKHRHQVVTMLSAVVVCFFVCQLPFRVRSLLNMFEHDELVMWIGGMRYNNLLFFCQIMIYIHSAANPILYNFMSKRFRKGFKNICYDIAHGFNRSQ